MDALRERNRCSWMCVKNGNRTKEKNWAVALRPHRAAVHAEAILDRIASAAAPGYCTDGVMPVAGVSISHGVWGINGAGLASGDATSTAMAPRSAPVKEWVTIG